MKRALLLCTFFITPVAYAGIIHSANQRAARVEFINRNQLEKRVPHSDQRFIARGLGCLVTSCKMAEFQRSLSEEESFRLQEWAQVMRGIFPSVCLEKRPTRREFPPVG